MKKAEDFRQAFGPVDSGFNTVFHKTIEQLQAGEQKKEKKLTALYPVRFRMAAAAAALVLLAGAGIYAATGRRGAVDPIDKIRGDLYTAEPVTTAFAQGMDDRNQNQMIPMTLSCEDQGIRMEMLSAFLEEKSVTFIYSMQDLEGDRIARCDIPYLDVDMGVLYKSIRQGVVDCDEAEQKATYCCRAEYNEPISLEERIITAYVKELDLMEVTKTDLVPLLKQYGKETEGVEPSSIGKWFVAGGHEDFRMPENLKLLDPRQPLDIPLAREAVLTGIGWIDGQLHVQVHLTDMKRVSTDAGSNTNWDVDILDYFSGTGFFEAKVSPVKWDDTGDGETDWIEFILDCKPEDIDRISLEAEVTERTDTIEGNWMFELPFSAIQPEKYTVTVKEDTVEYGDAEDALWELFTTWTGENAEHFFWMSTAEWRMNTENPADAITSLLENQGKPLAYQIDSVAETDDESGRRIICTVMMDRPDGTEQCQRYWIEYVKDGTGKYKLNPDSLEIRTDAECDPSREMYSLSEEGAVNRELDRYYTGVREQLKPVNVGIEDDWLRLEVVSGLVRDGEAWFLCTVQELKDKYQDYYWDLDFSDNVCSDDSCTYDQLYYDETERRRTVLISSEVSGGTADPVNFGIERIILSQSRTVDLVPLLKQYGETDAEGIKMPEFSENFIPEPLSDSGIPEDLKIFDYDHPLDIPLFGDVCLSRIGWIDGQLHVQLHNTGSGVVETEGGRYLAWDCYFSHNVPHRTYEKELDVASLRWCDDIRLATKWMEFISNCQPEEADRVQLEAEIRLITDVIKGSLEVQFPLSLITDEVPEGQEVPQ